MPILPLAMRRLLPLIAFLALALSAASVAAHAASGDGTVVVKNGDGAVSLKVKGAVIGHFASGSMDISDPDLTDGPGCTVTGADATRFISDTKTRYSGGDVHFRCVGGRFVIRFSRMRDLSLGAVGRGSVTLNGAGRSDGSFSIDGSAPTSLPDDPTTFFFGNVIGG
jgi:hypothetical protein